MHCVCGVLFYTFSEEKKGTESAPDVNYKIVLKLFFCELIMIITLINVDKNFLVSQCILI